MTRGIRQIHRFCDFVAQLNARGVEVEPRVTVRMFYPILKVLEDSKSESRIPQGGRYALISQTHGELVTKTGTIDNYRNTTPPGPSSTSLSF